MPAPAYGMQGASLHCYPERHLSTATRAADRPSSSRARAPQGEAPRTPGSTLDLLLAVALPNGCSESLLRLAAQVARVVVADGTRARAVRRSS